MTHNEKIQTAIDSINNLEISRQDKDRLIQQIKNAVPSEEDFKSRCEDAVQNLSRYDSSALGKIHIRIGEANKKPVVFVWYPYDGSATFVKLYFASWQKTLSALNDYFLKRVERLIEEEISPQDIGADRMVTQDVECLGIMSALASVGEAVFPIS